MPVSGGRHVPLDPFEEFDMGTRGIVLSSVVPDTILNDDDDLGTVLDEMPGEDMTTAKAEAASDVAFNGSSVKVANAASIKELGRSQGTREPTDEGEGVVVEKPGCLSVSKRWQRHVEAAIFLTILALTATVTKATERYLDSTASLAAAEDPNDEQQELVDTLKRVRRSPPLAKSPPPFPFSPSFSVSLAFDTIVPTAAKAPSPLPITLPPAPSALLSPSPPPPPQSHPAAAPSTPSPLLPFPSPLAEPPPLVHVQTEGQSVGTAKDKVPVTVPDRRPGMVATCERLNAQFAIGLGCVLQ